MRFSTITAALAGLGAVVARDPGHLRGVSTKLAERMEERQNSLRNAQPRKRSADASDASYESPYLNKFSQKYVVDGKKIPDVDFDIGESYAGLMPIGNTTEDEFYFWFFPSKNKLAGDEILIWLNGGPGCSSLEGLLQENGPFIWQYGTYQPQPNPWTWTNLTNVIWVEQPLGTGFDKGTPTAKSEFDVARQFMGFWKNLVDTFNLQGRKVYITGESYAGMYVPHIAYEFLKANDTKYYNVEGTMIYDPSINSNAIMNQVPAYRFLEQAAGLFALNDTFMKDLGARADKCGYNHYMDTYLAYPPKGPLPTPPYLNGATGECDVYDDIFNAALLVNPCWDVYQIETTCPLLWDVLGFPGTLYYQAQGTSAYFDRPDVKKAINAPNTTWSECAPINVYNTSNGLSTEANNNEYSGLTVLPYVIDHSKRTVIGHGGIDFVLINNGTLLTIQNMTFGGKQGFQKPITDDFYVPYHTDIQLSTVAASGVMGKTHTERGLTYVGINLSGHMVPQYQPSASYRHLEYLLGRIPSLSSTVPFTTSDQGYPAQPPYAASAEVEHKHDGNEE